MPKTSKCVDAVFVDRRGTCIVAECKGADIQHGIEQMNATVQYVKKMHSSIQPAGSQLHTS